MLCYGCTSKEQDEKIHAFWGGQAMKVMSNPAVSQAMMSVMMRGKKAAQGNAFGTQQMAFDEAELRKAFEALNAEDFEGVNFENPAAVEYKFERAQISTQVPGNKKDLNASSKKNPALQQMLDAVKESNERTFKAYSFLPVEKQQQIKAIMKDTEQDLQKLVDKNMATEEFLNAQFNRLDLQNDRISQVMIEESPDRTR